MTHERRTIMVVEDDEAVRGMMAEILRDAGHEVLECASGEDALSHLKTTHPALITLDLAMPTIDGFQFLYILQKRSETADIPVVIVTAAPEYMRFELLLQGETVVRKPFHTDRLLEVVEQAINGAPHAEPTGPVP